MLPLLVIPAVSALASGIALMINGSFRIHDARGRYDSRRASYTARVGAWESSEAATRGTVEELTEFRAQCLVTLEGAVQFLQAARANRPDFVRNLAVRHESAMPGWQGVQVQPLELLGAGVTASTAAFGAAATTTSAVTALASTAGGTAISGLSGVAATNATMAWLGGGSLASGGGGMSLGAAVLGGVASSAAVLVVGVVFFAKASSVETEVAAAIADMDVSEAKLNDVEVVLDALRRRCAEIRSALHDFRTQLEQLLGSARVDSELHVEFVFVAARGLAGVLRAQLLDEDGNPATRPVR